MSKTQTPQNPSAADATRMALVMAALKLFGRQGFDGTSTREIATAANANIGSIAYHFGGKEGLRLAAADHVVTTIQTVARQALGNTGPALPQAPTPEEAEAQIEAAVERMVGFMVARPEAGEIVQFVLRELSTPTDALDRIYSGVFEPVHRRLCQLWAAATGEEAESERVRISVFMMIGQVVYFRIARAAVMRRMDWADIGPAEVGKVIGIAKENVAAIIAARKAGKP
ncbi:CerR family C-terminal domain-containing protein [Aminobacter carboxidus]|uniref:AcrR family transcriptional regulator n=1 Tax=Aminobacter carboxidus TaxID=376165 RepID=A0A8E1WIB0_9HYPH|nr:MULTISPECIES: CerR family C-terminal domain-containing protein [Aminobacter carboxidus group]MBB6467697.1 AcrR family transcriptional regulator [Aminobacter lissarensis]MBE1205811.1 CerR family C-terminal domain-containing protein [Aminobacter carboxidus]